MPSSFQRTEQRDKNPVMDDKLRGTSAPWKHRTIKWRTHSLVPLAVWMICNKHRPNSSRIILSVTAWDFPTLSASAAWANRHWQVACTTSSVTNENGSLSPELVKKVGRDGRSSIWDSSLVLAAFCCFTRTSAASARCIKVFLSGLSSKFLHPVHLQIFVHNILAS